jgi:hypothetical protein
MRLALTGFALAALAGAARADFTFSPGGIQFSAGPKGSAGNTVLLHTYTGPDTIIGSSTFGAGYSALIPASLPGEASWNIRNTRFAVTTGADFQMTRTGGGSGTILIASTPGAGMILRTGDVLRFETFESFDDGAGADAAWTDVSWAFTDAVVTSLGTFSSVDSIITSGGAPPFGTDTMIGLYGSDGTLIASNDDFGGVSGGGLAGLGLTTGSYYLAVIPYDAGVAGDFAHSICSPGADASGAYMLSVNGSLVASSTLATHETEWYSFSVPAPGASSVLLGLVIVAGRRRRQVVSGQGGG